MVSTDIDLRALGHFLSVVEHGGVREAARRIHVAQPALSRTVSELEAELGVRLFERTGRRMEPTAVAISLANDVRELLGHRDAIVARARGYAEGSVGKLRLGTSPSATFHPRVPAIVRAERELSPSVEIELVEGSTASLLDAIRRRELDAAFVRPGGALEAPLVARVLDRERVLAVLPVGHPLARRASVHARDLLAHPLLLPTASLGSSLSNLVAALAIEHEMRPVVAAHASHVASLVHLVAAGLGVAFVPASLRSLGTRGVRFVPVAGQRVRLPLALVHSEVSSNPALGPFVTRALGRTR